MNGCSDPVLWAARTDYIESFVTKFMPMADRMRGAQDHEYIFRLTAALVWEKEVEEYLTCGCDV